MEMETTLASNTDAQLILKLYELRTETVLRAARKWATADFWPHSAEDVLKVMRASGTQENAYLRQVGSYWEMAAAMVLHGAINAALFFDCNGENLFIYCKIEKFIEEIRKESPHFFSQTQKLVEKFPRAQKHLEGLRVRLADKLK